MKDLQSSGICTATGRKKQTKIPYEKQKENRTLPQKSSSPHLFFVRDFLFWLFVVGCWLRIKPVETDDQSMNCLNGFVFFGKVSKGSEGASTMRKSPFPRKGLAGVASPGDRRIFARCHRQVGKGG